MTVYLDYADLFMATLHQKTCMFTLRSTNILKGSSNRQMSPKAGTVSSDNLPVPIFDRTDRSLQVSAATAL